MGHQPDSWASARRNQIRGSRFEPGEVDGAVSGKPGADTGRKCQAKEKQYSRGAGASVVREYVASEQHGGDQKKSDDGWSVTPWKLGECEWIFSNREPLGA